MNSPRIFSLFVTASLLFVAPLPAADVIVYVAGKSRIYGQAPGAQPKLISSFPYDAFARVYPNPQVPGGVIAAQVGPQGNPEDELLLVANAAVPQLSYSAGGFATKAALDAEVPNGIYVMRMVTQNDGTVFAHIDVSPDSYPAPPRVLNTLALVNVNPALPQSVNWTRFTPSDGNDAIIVSIYDDQTFTEVFQTPLPTEPGVLGAGVTNYVIPADMLLPNHSYSVRLDFIKVVNETFGPYPGGVKGLGVFLTRTVVDLRTKDAVPPPVITQPPTNQVAPLNRPAVFSVVATGPGPLHFHWRHNGVPIPGATNSTLLISNAQPAQSGDYTVLVRNSAGTIISSVATLTVLLPPVIVTQPRSQTVDPGATVNFTVSSTNLPPPLYQWYVNGERIPGATNAALTLPNVQPADGGTYYAVAGNGGGATSSSNAVLLVRTPPLFLGDNLADRPRATVASNAGGGSNAMATREPGEPDHGGRTGGRSVWLGWVAPDNGVVTFDTRGSAFDTLLAAYTGTSIANLVPIFGDDDSGGRLTSMIQFNATAGVEYLIAVDGRAGAFGDIVLSWNFVSGPRDFPRIVQQPISLALPAGSNATFVVNVEGDGLQFQWFFNDVELNGATASTLVVPNIQLANAGIYRVRISNDNRVTTSDPAALEIIRQPTTPTQDKFDDALDSGAVRALLGEPGHRKFVAPAAGVLGTQTLNNYGATKESGEPNHGGVLGGASRWQVVVPEADGILQLDTEGSGPDSVLAVYTGASLTALTLVAEDNNSGPDGRSARVRFPVTAGVNYLVAVDTVSGAEGLLQLNWRLGLLPVVTLPSSQLFTPGTDLVLNATVSGGTGPFTYRWSKDSEVIPGVEVPTLPLNNLQADSAGYYGLSVSNSAGEVFRRVLVAQVGPAPLVLADPVGGVSPQGSNIALTVESAATLPIRYQWLYKGKAIRGATNATYTLNRPTTRQSGAYSVAVTTTAGAVTSAVATVSVLVPAQIKTQPKTLLAGLGKKSTFTVKAAGSAPLIYQWQFNGVDIAGASGPSFSIGSVQATDIGTYRVVVSNILGAVTSAPARLAAVVIKTQPRSLTLAEGAKASFKVVAQGTPPLRYQWLHSGQILPGETNAALLIASATRAQEGSYAVTITNALGSVTSSNATLSITASALSPLLLQTVHPSVGTDSDTAPSLQLDVLPGGRIQLTIHGQAQARYLIEASTDLIGWESVGTVQLATGAAEWVDGEGDQHRQRFYRLREIK